MVYGASCCWRGAEAGRGRGDHCRWTRLRALDLVEMKWAREVFAERSAGSGRSSMRFGGEGAGDIARRAGGVKAPSVSWSQGSEGSDETERRAPFGDRGRVIDGKGCDEGDMKWSSSIKRSSASSSGFSPEEFSTVSRKSLCLDGETAPDSTSSEVSSRARLPPRQRTSCSLRV